MLSYTFSNYAVQFTYIREGRCGGDHMTVEFITTYAISAYTHVVSLNPA